MNTQTIETALNSSFVVRVYAKRGRKAVDHSFDTKSQADSFANRKVREERLTIRRLYVCDDDAEFTAEQIARVTASENFFFLISAKRGE